MEVVGENELHNVVGEKLIGNFGWLATAIIGW